MNAQTGSTNLGSGTSFGSGEDYNSAFGESSLESNTTGDSNTASGAFSLRPTRCECCYWLRCFT